MMGAYIGPEHVHVERNAWNPTGHWERKDVLQLNVELLASAGCDYHTVSRFSGSRVSQDARNRFCESAAPVLLELDAHEPWVVKDPRLCLTLPFWRPLLETPICVLVYRHPLEVARSLADRDGLPVEVGVALWERYNLEALDNTHSLPRVLVSYARLMQEPVDTLRLLRSQLETAGAGELRMPASREIRAFIDPALYRHRLPATVPHDVVNAEQHRLHTSLGSGQAQDLNMRPALSDAARATLSEFERTDTARCHLETTHTELQRRLRESGRLNHQLELEIETRRARVASPRDEMLGWEERLRREQATVSQLEHRVTRLQDQVAVTQDKSRELDRTVRELARTVCRIQSGLGWRVLECVRRSVLFVFPVRSRRGRGLGLTVAYLRAFLTWGWAIFRRGGMDKVRSQYQFGLEPVRREHDLESS